MYRYNHLNYIATFNGNKHELQSKIKHKNTAFFIDGSFLTNTSTSEENSFLRAKATIEHRFEKSWLGAFINLETNSRKIVILKITSIQVTGIRNLKPILVLEIQQKYLPRLVLIIEIMIV